MSARELLDIAAEYVEAKRDADLAEAYAGDAADLDAIAERFSAALDLHLA